MHFLVLLLFFIAIHVLPAHAADTIPACVQSATKEPMQLVGKSRFRKFGFTIYSATLWAPRGVYDPNQPYALQLVYARDLDKETLVDAIVTDFSYQGEVDIETQNAWATKINSLMPAVAENDSVIGVFIPNKPSAVFHNCMQLGAIEDPVLTKAFFSIWLGPKADDDMRTSLINSRMAER